VKTYSGGKRSEEEKTPQQMDIPEFCPLPFWCVLLDQRTPNSLKTVSVNHGYSLVIHIFMYIRPENKLVEDYHLRNRNLRIFFYR
jgi:hypothetical protein